jgi:hypothetical protein
MLHAHDAIRAATHVYLASVLFSRETMLLLATLLDVAPKLLAVATLQEFPLESAWSFACGRRAVRARMTWNTAESGDRGSAVYVYRRKPSSCSVDAVRLLWTFSASKAKGVSVRIWIRCAS